MILQYILQFYQSFCELAKDDNLVFLGILITSFPAALFMKYIPSAPAKQTFSICLALSQTYMVCRMDTIIPLLMCGCSYLAMCVAPKQSVGRITFHAMFSILLIFRLLIFTEMFKPSYLTNAVLLLMTLRICSYAYDYQKNQVLDSDVGNNADSGVGNNTDSDVGNKAAFGVGNKTDSVLSPFFDYVGYCFCFVGFWTGPFYNFRTYNNMLYSKTLIRSSRLALRHMRLILLLIPLYLAQNNFNDLDYVKTDDFLDRSLSFKTLYLAAGFWTFKMKFYVAWIIAEGVCIACNLGVVESETGLVKYDDIINIDIYNVERQWEFNQCVRAWNKSVQRWMRLYVYETTTLPRSIKTDFVFALSAFWHGVRPGYYLCFICAPPMIKLQKKVKNLTYDLRENHKIFEVMYRIFFWLLIRSTSAVFLVPFIVLELNRTLMVWRSMYWIPQMWLAGIFLAGILLPESKRKKSEDKKTE